MARVHAAIGERIAAKCRAAGVKELQCAVDSGDPVRAILQHAEAEGADLIVLGTRGLSSLKGLLMGSVSQRVCQRAKCPCLIVKEPMNKS